VSRNRPRFQKRDPTSQDYRPQREDLQHLIIAAGRGIERTFQMMGDSRFVQLVKVASLPDVPCQNTRKCQVPYHLDAVV
jgi:hypothetical protein